MKLSNINGNPVCLFIPIGTPTSCPASALTKGNTVAIEPLSNVCFLVILLLLRGRFDLNPSSCKAHAVFKLIKFFEASIAKSSEYLSNSSFE
ncbi:hypothetical protein D3C73_1196230 [compost metagenome]